MLTETHIYRSSTPDLVQLHAADHGRQGFVCVDTPNVNKKGYKMCQSAPLCTRKTPSRNTYIIWPYIHPYVCASVSMCPCPRLSLCMRVCVCVAFFVAARSNTNQEKLCAKCDHHVRGDHECDHHVRGDHVSATPTRNT